MKICKDLQYIIEICKDLEYNIVNSIIIGIQQKIIIYLKIVSLLI